VAAGTGELYLLSLWAVPDPLGTAGLDILLGRARAAAVAAGSNCAALLADRLGAAGVPPTDDARYGEPLRVGLQELYRVGPGFPRLVPASFGGGPPAGVVDVAYSVDTSACRRPGRPRLRRGHRTRRSGRHRRPALR